MTERKAFRWRGLITFLVTISFVVDTLSGIILYIAPPGRIANWTNWKIWGLTKEQWAAVHTVFGYVLLLIVAVHLYYNWNLFVGYLWKKAKRAMNLKRELTLSILLCLLVFLGSIWSIPPFSTVMNIGEQCKESWEQGKIRTPVPHAELLSLKDFAETIKIPVEEITEIMKEKGYYYEDIHQIIREIAKVNNVSPSRLYEDIRARNTISSSMQTFKGSGMGRKTLKMICEEQGLSIEEALSRLKEQDLEAKPEDHLKDLTAKIGKTPTEIFNILREK